MFSVLILVYLRHDHSSCCSPFLRPDEAALGVPVAAVRYGHIVTVGPRGHAVHCVCAGQALRVCRWTPKLQSVVELDISGQIHLEGVCILALLPGDLTVALLLADTGPVVLALKVVVSAGGRVEVE